MSTSLGWTPPDGTKSYQGSCSSGHRQTLCPRFWMKTSKAKESKGPPRKEWSWRWIRTWQAITALAGSKFLLDDHQTTLFLSGKLPREIKYQRVNKDASYWALNQALRSIRKGCARCLGNFRFSFQHQQGWLWTDLMEVSQPTTVPDGWLTSVWELAQVRKIKVQAEGHPP